MKLASVMMMSCLFFMGCLKLRLHDFSNCWLSSLKVSKNVFGMQNCDVSLSRLKKGDSFSDKQGM